MLKRTDGVTLIEVMLSAFCLLLCLSAVFGMYIACLGEVSQTGYHDQSVGNAQEGLQYLECDLRNASKVNTSYGSITTGTSAIAIALPAYNSSGVIAGSTDYITYTVDSSKYLRRSVYPATGSKRGADVNRIVARYVTGLSLSYKAHDFFTASGSASTFTLRTNWSATPSAYANGSLITSAITYNTSTLVSTLSYTPASGVGIQFTYPINCALATPLSYADEVDITLTTQAPGDSSSALVMGSGILRNN
jgi:Tfp pilus assembly protein PilV